MANTPKYPNEIVSTPLTIAGEVNPVPPQGTIVEQAPNGQRIDRILVTSTAPEDICIRLLVGNVTLRTVTIPGRIGADADTDVLDLLANIGPIMLGPSESIRVGSASDVVPTSARLYFIPQGGRY